MRTCVGCRMVEPKAALVRAVEGGRGAYVHPREICIKAAERGGVQRSLRRAISPEEIRRTIVKNSAGLRQPNAVETAPRVSGAQT